LDGFGVIRMIRESPRFASLPVVAVTAYAMQGDREKILSSKFDGYLSKPVNARSLGEELDRLLSTGGTGISENLTSGSQTSGKARASH